MTQNIRPVINAETFENLRALGGDDNANFLEELINVYLAQAPEKMAKMRAAHKQNDLKLLRDSAHSLKSSSGNMGADIVHGLCQEIERAAFSNQKDFPFAERIELLDLELHAVYKELQYLLEVHLKKAV